MSVTLSPKATTLPLGASQIFVCVVTNASDTTCTWTIQEGASGGTVSSSGLYTAPSTAGTYHLVANSKADASKSDSAVITVIVPVPGVWTNVTPAGITNGATDVVVDPTRPSNLYAGTNQNGIWKSTNYGLTWTKINTGTNGAHLSTGVNQGAGIAVNPSNPSGPPVLYFSSSVTADLKGLYVSTNDGVDWVVLSPDNTQTDPLFRNDVYAVAVDPTDANHVVIGFHGVIGLSETLNALAPTPTWRTVPTQGGPQGTSLFPFWVNPSPSERAAGATISTTWLTQSQWGEGGAGIWRTTDSGNTWTKVLALDHPHGNAQMIDLGEGLIYAAGYPNPGVAQGVWKSNNYGVNWTNLYSGAPEGGVVATASRLYASNGFAGPISPNLIHAFRSSDTAWTTDTEPSGMNCGWKRASITFDGTHYILVGGFWLAGIWRYVE